MTRNLPALTNAGGILLVLIAGGCGRKSPVTEHSLLVKWQFSADDEIVSTPALAADGTIYVPSQDVGKGQNGSNLFSLYSLHPQGAIKWRLPVDALLEHGPAIASDGTVYVGTRSDGAIGVKLHSGTLYAIGESNGGLMRGGWPKTHGSAANDGRAPSAP